MDHEHRYIPRTGAMFSRGTLARAELATDLAIGIVAEGGWPALTLRNVASAANLTPQAIAAWFPSVGAMRIAVASVYGRRWISQLRYRSLTRARRSNESPLDLTALTAALLPQTWLEEVFDGVWLSVVEAGRWDEAIGRTVASVQQDELDIVLDLADGSGHDAETALALLRGLRASPRWR
jgi:AcrR family transcriptional regulator